jgi:nitrate reductase beta subunit
VCVVHFVCEVARSSAAGASRFLGVAVFDPDCVQRAAACARETSGRVLVFSFDGPWMCK